MREAAAAHKAAVTKIDEGALSNAFSLTSCCRSAVKATIGQGKGILKQMIYLDEDTARTVPEKEKITAFHRKIGNAAEVIEESRHTWNRIEWPG